MGGGAEADEVKRVLEEHGQSVRVLVGRDKKQRELAKKQERWNVEGSEERGWADRFKGI